MTLFSTLFARRPARDAVEPRMARDGSDAGTTVDILGPYPAERDVPALETRRYLWTARAFAIGLFLSLLLNVTLGFAVSSLSPLVRIQPMLLTVKNKSEQIVRVEPFERGTRGFEVMTETLVREYVETRNAIVENEEEMRFRWGGAGLIAHRSTPEEYLRFAKAMESIYEELLDRKVTRAVDVKSVSKIADGYWQAEFVTTDYDELDEKILETRWVASMTVSYLPREVSWEDRYMNPLGFTVTAYSMAMKS
jgi:type IV secretion system protein VirB8